MGKRTDKYRRITLTPRDEEVETPMHAIAALPLLVILAALLWLLAAIALWQGIRELATGLCAVNHPASALRMVRGILGVTVAVSAAALSGGMLFASTGLLALWPRAMTRMVPRAVRRGSGAPSPPRRRSGASIVHCAGASPASVEPTGPYPTADDARHPPGIRDRTAAGCQPPQYTMRYLAAHAAPRRRRPQPLGE
jgi:hypothetical protein